MVLIAISCAVAIIVLTVVVYVLINRLVPASAHGKKPAQGNQYTHYTYTPVIVFLPQRIGNAFGSRSQLLPICSPTWLAWQRMFLSLLYKTVYQERWVLCHVESWSWQSIRFKESINQRALAGDTNSVLSWLRSRSVLPAILNADPCSYAVLNLRHRHKHRLILKHICQCHCQDLWLQKIKRFRWKEVSLW